jgi:hypothetical protein
VLKRIRYLAENGLTSLMVLHEFLSKCLAPRQDQPHPAWMYTGVNDIIRLDRGPRSSLDEVLLAASLKALTTNQFSAELVVPPVVCEPIYVNQATRTTQEAAPLWPLARVRINMHVSALTTMKYRSTRMSLCRSGYNCRPAPVG